jgi:hypothetical protein
MQKHEFYLLVFSVPYIAIVKYSSKATNILFSQLICISNDKKINYINYLMEISKDYRGTVA